MVREASACGSHFSVTEFPKAIQPVIQQFASANGCVDVWDNFLQAADYSQSWAFAQVNQRLDARRFEPGQPQAASHVVTAMGTDKSVYEYSVLDVCDGAAVAKNGVSQKIQVRNLNTGEVQVAPLGGSLVEVEVKDFFLNEGIKPLSVFGDFVPVYKLGHVQQIATNGAYVFLRFEGSCSQTGVMKAGSVFPTLYNDWEFCAMGGMQFAVFNVDKDALYLNGCLASGQPSGVADYSQHTTFPFATKTEIAADAAVK